jgi:hypothetical protein
MKILIFVVVSDVDSDDDIDDTLDESTENLIDEIPKNDSSNVSLTTSSCRLPLTSVPDNTERRHELNRSVLLHKKNQSDQFLSNKRSSGIIDDNDNRDRSMYSPKHIDDNGLEASQ